MPQTAIAVSRRSSAAVVGPRYAPLVIMLAAACTGIVADRLWPVAAGAWLIAGFAAALSWLAMWALRRERAASFALCLCAAALGGAWHHAWWRLYPTDCVAGMTGPEPQAAVVEAIALYAPRHVPVPPPDPLKAMQTGERSRFEVRIVAVRDGRNWQPASGNALALVEGRLVGVFAGDRVRIVGALSGTSPPQNPGEVDFQSYARAERRSAFLSVSFPQCVSVIQRGSPWHWRRWLDAMRQGGDRLLWQHIAPQRAGLAAALLLGAREQLDAERTAAFLRTNTIHILAISGMHVAILAASLFYTLRLGVTSRRTTLAALVALATVLYTLLTDAPPSAVRAMILVLLVCLAMFAGRGAAAFNWWAAGGLVVLALNPADLFRAGTQLSFLAVAAMAWIAPRWSAWRRLEPLDLLILRTRPWPIRALRWSERSMVRATAVTAVIWLATMPLVAARFHILSPAALVLTTLLIVPVSVALMSGFATMLLGWIPPLAAVCGAVCDGSLQLIDACVVGASRAPASHFWLPGPEEWWMAGFYLGLALLVVVPRMHWTRYAQLAGVWMAVGLALPIGQRSEKPLECAFLSIGHGTSVVLRTPEGQTILYDAGRLGSPVGGSRSIGGALWAEGIMRLDAVVISHADIDHYNALPELLQQFGVDTIYVSPLMFREDVEPLRLLREAIQASGASLCQLSAGDQLKFGDSTVITVLHPPAGGVPGTDNAQSIVLAIECHGRRVLLPGDLETPGTQSLLAQPSWDCDVLLAPHHGSARSNPPGFSGWCRPEWVVISGSRSQDRAGGVRAGYRSIDARVFHTAHDGAVRFSFSPTAISAARWHDGGWEPCER